MTEHPDHGSDHEPSVRERVFRFRGAFLVAATIPAAVLPGRDGGWWQASIALAVVAVGAWLRVSGVRWIGRRAKVYRASARELLTSGVFGHLRNPLYLGNALVASGVCVALRSVEGGLLAFVGGGVVYTLVARHEEVQLRELFGAQFDEYTKNVRRWWPRWSPWRSGTPTEPVAWSEVMRSERGFVVGTSVAFLFVAAAAAGLGPAQWIQSAVMGVPPLVATAVVLTVTGFLMLKIQLHRLSQLQRPIWQRPPVPEPAPTYVPLSLRRFASRRLPDPE